MTIKDCPNCGGIHYGSYECPYTSAPCIICGTSTILACSDCAIDSGGKNSVHVCEKELCRDAHEKMHSVLTDEELAEAGEMNGWQLIETSLYQEWPEIDLWVTYSVHDNYRATNCIWQRGRWKKWEGGQLTNVEVYGCKVTHWMPIPEPPPAQQKDGKP